MIGPLRKDFVGLKVWVHRHNFLVVFVQGHFHTHPMTFHHHYFNDNSIYFFDFSVILLLTDEFGENSVWILICSEVESFYFMSIITKSCFTFSRTQKYTENWTHLFIENFDCFANQNKSKMKEAENCSYVPNYQQSKYKTCLAGWYLLKIHELFACKMCYLQMSTRVLYVPACNFAATDMLASAECE